MGPHPLVARDAGNRSRPAAGRGCGQDALAVGALVRSRTEPATPGQVLPGQPAKVLTDRNKDLLVAAVQSQPGADPRARRSRNDERRRQTPHRPATPTFTDSSFRTGAVPRTRSRDRPGPWRYPFTPSRYFAKGVAGIGYALAASAVASATTPRSLSTSSSATCQAGATLFLVTWTRMRLPTTWPPSRTCPRGRRSSRTEA
jgi:hypothetical protein